MRPFLYVCTSDSVTTFVDKQRITYKMTINACERSPISNNCRNVVQFRSMLLFSNPPGICGGSVETVSSDHFVSDQKF